MTGLRMKNETLKTEISMQKGKIHELECKLAVSKQELRILGKRPAPEEYRDPSQIIEGVTQAIQTRR